MPRVGFAVLLLLAVATLAAAVDLNHLRSNRVNRVSATIVSANPSALKDQDKYDWAEITDPNSDSHVPTMSMSEAVERFAEIRADSKATAHVATKTVADPLLQYPYNTYTTYSAAVEGVYAAPSGYPYPNVYHNYNPTMFTQSVAPGAIPGYVPATHGYVAHGYVPAANGYTPSAYAGYHGAAGFGPIPPPMPTYLPPPPALPQSGSESTPSS